MAEGGTATGALAVEVVGHIDDALAEEWYAVYRAAFEPLTTRAVARHVLHEHEFLEEMTDPRVWKYVVRDGAGEVVGLTTLTRDLDTVPWISPQWFAHHFPEHTSRGAVYYLGFTLVAPGRRRERVFETMLGAVVQRLVADDAVCGYDLCAFNVEVGFRSGIERILTGSAQVAPVDLQHYFAADFSTLAGGRP